MASYEKMRFTTRVESFCGILSVNQQIEIDKSPPMKAKPTSIEYTNGALLYIPQGNVQVRSTRLQLENGKISFPVQSNAWLCHIQGLHPCDISCLSQA